MNKLYKNTKRLILAVFAFATLSVAVAVPSGVSAIDVWDACPSGSTSKVCNSKNSDTVGGLMQNIINILLWAIGIASVIMIVIGGFKYVTSNGDSNQLTSAKNTILYAVIGLVVAVLGQAIVYFVVDRL